MTEVIVVCEGQSEEAFVREALYSDLSPRSVFVQPRLVATSPRSKGGALKGQRVLRFLRNTLRERRDTYVTTFFDLYALPSDFPGLPRDVAQKDPIDRATEIEAGFSAAVIREAECRPERFLPHIQPFEFESLLFSEPAWFAEAEPEWTAFTSRLEEVRRSARTPEHINDGPDTHPSAHLRKLLRPPYHKVRHGAAISARLSLDRICDECRHFNQWLRRLRGLAQPEQE